MEASDYRQVQAALPMVVKLMVSTDVIQNVQYMLIWMKFHKYTKFWVRMFY
jgi:hypothetical protein